MKKPLLILTLLSLLVGQETLSQQKQFTLEEAVIGRWQGLSPDNLRDLKWIPGKDRFSFIDGDRLIQGTPYSKEQQEVITLKDLNELTGSGDQQMKRFPRFSWTGPETLIFHSGNRWFKLNPYQKKLIQSTSLPADAENTDYCRDNGHIAYTIDNNLFIGDFSGQAVPISQEKNRDIVFGQEVHRREFGIHTGTFWSPGGKKLAFYRKDESMVTDYPLVNIDKRVAELQSIKYPMAGMKSHHVKVGVYDLGKQDTVYLKTGRPLDQYLTNVAWGPEGKYLYIAHLNRDQNHMQLNRYEALSGELEKSLFEETDDKYVEPTTPVSFIPGKKDHFVWLSRRDGFRHIYLYQTNGKLIRQLTRGEWEVTGLKGFDEQGEHLYFTGTRESPLERHLYKVNLSSGNITRMTGDAGYHRPMVSENGNYILDRFSNRDNPRTILVINQKGETTRKLLQAEDPLKDYDLGDVEISTIKAADGETDLYYRLIKPAGLDPGKKYPAIVYVYGGPHAQLVQNRWLGGASLWLHYMAQQGYVILTLDNRGSDARGMQFESVIHRNLGHHEVADQMQGLKLLKRKDYVDQNRIGVHGWSYGGFMTTSLMLKQPGMFKAGVAGGPVIDWKYYEVMYGERYMDTPQDNPKGYQQANLKNYVGKLDGELMLIHGYLDDVVVLQHSLSFIRKCVQEGKQIDFFVYPRHQHGVGGRDRIHLMRKITDYFNRHLKEKM